MIRLTDINEFEHVMAVIQQMPEDERVLFKAMTGDDFDAENVLVAMADLPGTHHLFWVGDKPIAVGGFIPQRKGVFRTWFIAPDSAWTDHGEDLTETCKSLISGMLEDGLAHRIETVTLADRAKARAWYERIGLAFESTQRKYGSDGQDAVMYVALSGAETG